MANSSSTVKYVWLISVLYVGNDVIYFQQRSIDGRESGQWDFFVHVNPKFVKSKKICNDVMYS